MKKSEEKKKMNLRNLVPNFFVSRNLFGEFIEASSFLIDGFGYFCWIALEKKYTKSIYYDIGSILNILILEKNSSILSLFYRKKILLRFEKRLRFFPPSVLSNKIPHTKEFFKFLKKFDLNKKICNSFVFEKNKFTKIKNITLKFIKLDKFYFNFLMSRFKIKTSFESSFNHE